MSEQQHKPIAAHTPGKWVKGDGEDYSKVFSADGLVICDTESADIDPESYRPLEEVEANARLIAAAPDLLKALKKCKSLLEDADIVIRRTHRDDSATAKACIKGADNAAAALARAIEQDGEVR